MKNINIIKIFQLLILVGASIVGAVLGRYDVATWILLMGIFADRIDKK